MTNHGTFVCELDVEHAPKAAANFIGLATAQRPWLESATGRVRTNAFFDGLTFHRVVGGSLIQSGAADGSVTFQPGYTFSDETWPGLGMERAGVLVTVAPAVDQNGSQFLLTLSATRPAGHHGTPFGQVISGMEVVEAIGAIATDASGRPLAPAQIEHVTIRRTAAAVRDFDVTAQGLPLVVNGNLAVEPTLTGVILRSRTSASSVDRVYVSSDLQTWAEQTVDWVTEPDGRRSARLLAGSERSFFRLVQTQAGDDSQGHAFGLPIAADGLEGYWRLDDDWLDALGRHALLPVRPGGFGAAPFVAAGTNQAYGPTGFITNNGAIAAEFTTLDEARGITLEGWIALPDDNTKGVLFGFGDEDWDSAKLNLTAQWGYLAVGLGRQGDGAVARYSRVGDTCWHHVALVLPLGFRAGVPFRFYVDGEKVLPNAIEGWSGTNRLTFATRLSGSPFRIGQFLSAEDFPSGGRAKVDEVRVWSRELAAWEVSRLAQPRGTGRRCDENRPPDWAPGLRFVPPTVDPMPALSLGVHVLSDEYIAVITDPNPWLKERFRADCGTFFEALERARPDLEAWVGPHYYSLGGAEVVQHYRPALLDALPRSGHWRIAAAGRPEQTVPTLALWPQITREFRLPRLSPGRGEEHIPSAEMVYYSYLKLPFRQVPGTTYRVTDVWNNRMEWTYDEQRTISWALKVNQVGYLADAAQKFGYLGSWLGPQGGALDVSRYAGAPFYVCQESDGAVVYTGTVRFRADETEPVEIGGGARVVLSGERVYELDFSALNTPGRYYLRVPGVGRSWAFALGSEAMGEAFYVHARGLYHQRCGLELAPAHTGWPRGDAHTNTYRAAFPTETYAWADHTAESWGLRDAAGRFPTLPADGNVAFEAVKATGTTERLPEVIGGWHDAGDFDRAGFRNLITVEDLAVAYLLFPENFTDGQLNLPESGNGVPDLLDEAMWGAEIWRRAQEPDGRVALHVEANSHPQVSDPAQDPQAYYLGLATRDSSLEWAEHAARLARALQRAGAVEPAARFLDSARRAYAFGARSGPPISVEMQLYDSATTWTEPADPDPKAQVRALVQLWLASADASYRTALETPALAAAFRQDAIDLYWRTSAFDWIDVALQPESFPVGWGDHARQEILRNAEVWLLGQAAHAHRKVWYGPGQGYFPNTMWGAAGFRPIRELIAAWRLTRDARYRTAALLGVDWLHGANPQGRVNTTGLGANYVVHPLHLPADSDGIADPVPGITIYGYSLGIAYAARTEAYGLFHEVRVTDGFDLPNLAQLPPPWDDRHLGMETIRDVLENQVPMWRRLIALEAANPPQMEFGLNETIGHAAAVTGCLLNPGWMPSAALRERRPRSESALQDALWYHP